MHLGRGSGGPHARTHPRALRGLRPWSILSPHTQTEVSGPFHASGGLHASSPSPLPLGPWRGAQGSKGRTAALGASFKRLKVARAAPAAQWIPRPPARASPEREGPRLDVDGGEGGPTADVAHPRAGPSPPAGASREPKARSARPDLSPLRGRRGQVRRPAEDGGDERTTVAMEKGRRRGLLSRPSSKPPRVR